MITFDVDMSQELCHNDVLNAIALLFMLSHNLIKVIVELNLYHRRIKYMPSHNYLCNRIIIYEIA